MGSTVMRVFRLNTPLGAAEANYFLGRVAQLLTEFRVRKEDNGTTLVVDMEEADFSDVRDAVFAHMADWSSMSIERRAAYWGPDTWIAKPSCPKVRDDWKAWKIMRMFDNAYQAEDYLCKEPAPCCTTCGVERNWTVEEAK